jgi:hypothetical protein
MLQEMGIYDFWCFPASVVNIECFIAQFRLRLKVIYIGQWREAVSILTAFTLYEKN